MEQDNSRKPSTRKSRELTQDEAEGLALTQAQILDAYNAGSTDKESYFSRLDALDGPFVHTDEDS